MKTFALALFVMLSVSANAQWTRVTNGLAANATVTSLTRHDGSLFALEPLTTTRFGIFRSTNDGVSWSRVGTLNVQTAVLPLDIDAKIHSVGTVLLITTTLNGVYRSTDNGASWTPSVSGLPDNVRTVHALLSLSGRMLIGTNNGVYTSTNAGQSWSLSNQGI
ncbi:MAG: WD40/YVTN/BNR-like repeat-containing protein, partial [Candidatus Thermochlorobacter sp.]